MKFIKGKMDFELPKAKLGNYFFGNILNPKGTLLSFTFDAFLQSEDFYLDKLVYDKIAMTYSFVLVTVLDNSYKETGYFNDVPIIPELETGFYRLRAGSYYGASLFEVKDIDVSNILAFSDFENENFIDNENDFLTE